MLWHIIIAIVIINCCYFALVDLIKHSGDLDFNHIIINEQIHWIKVDKYDRIRIGQDSEGQDFEEITFFDNTYKEKVFAGYLSFNILPEHKKLPDLWCEQVTYSKLEPAINSQKPMEAILFFKIVGKKKDKILTNGTGYVKTITPLDGNYQPAGEPKVIKYN